MPAAEVWDVLVAVDRWPEWGPSLTAARLDGGGGRLHAGATGAVRTPVGIWVPFRVTLWEEGRCWAWKVAGVSTTSHGVEPLACDRSRVVFGVPLWAPAYLPVVTVALRRIRSIAEAPHP